MAQVKYKMLIMKRLNRYYRYFCRALVALFWIFLMVWILNAIFADGILLFLVSAIGVVFVTTLVITHICERAFRQ